jgi:hypothetical protein
MLFFGPAYLSFTEEQLGSAVDRFNAVLSKASKTNRPMLKSLRNSQADFLGVDFSAFMQGPRIVGWVGNTDYIDGEVFDAGSVLLVLFLEGADGTRPSIDPFKVAEMAFPVQVTSVTPKGLSLYAIGKLW